MAQIVVDETTDYRAVLLPAGITDIIFAASESASAVFDPGQFGGNPISDTVTVTGDAHLNYVDVTTADAVTFSAAGWSFVDWHSADSVRIFGSDADQTFIGSSRSDFISGDGGLDHLEGGAGADMFQTSPSGVFEDGSVIDGGTDSGGRDIITSVGLAGTNDLRPVEIFDIEELGLFATGVTTRVTGEQVNATAIDRVSILASSSVTLEVYGDTVDLTGVAIAGWTADDTIHLFGTSFASNTLIGSNRPDEIDGVFMSADDMTGGAGADTMRGGMGADLFRYTAASHAVAGESIDGGSATDAILLDGAGGIIDFRPVDINLVEVVHFLNGGWTARFNGDQVTGGALDIIDASTGADAIVIYAVAGLVDLSGVAFNVWNNAVDTITLDGSADADLLRGSFQNDILNGRAGADDLRGGFGNDTYIVDAAGDTITELAGNGTDLVRSSAASFTLAAAQEIENLTLTGSGDNDGTGNGLANFITGNTGDNTLAGEGGNDTLDGGGGTDTLIGGAGDDTYIGVTLTGPGADSIVEEAAGGNADIVRSAATTSLANADFVERLTLTGNGDVNGTGNTLANVIVGNGGANILTGGTGADTLIGGGGNDVLIGGKNNDLMNGGSGADTFRFAVANTHADTISGFSVTDDRFDLSGGTFSARAEAGGDTTLTHAGGTIVVSGVTGLSLAQWNDLVLPSGGGASVSSGEAALAAAWAAPHLGSWHFGHADYLFA